MSDWSMVVVDVWDDPVQVDNSTHTPTILAPYNRTNKIVRLEFLAAAGQQTSAARQEKQTRDRFVAIHDLWPRAGGVCARLFAR